MQDIFEKLQQLQKVLSRKFEIMKEIEEIPKALSTKSEMLKRLKQSYLEKNSTYEAGVERMKHYKHLMGEAEIHREDSEKKMDNITTQREYEALDTEIRDASEREQNFRKDIQREETVLEELKESMEREEKLIKLQESELNEEQIKVEDETKERQKELDHLVNVEESAIIPDIDSEIVFKFERIISNKSGLGLVPVKNGVCTGCNMNLPAQFVNDVRSEEKVLFCPYCSRILFYEEDSNNNTESVGDVKETEEVGGLSDLAGDMDLDWE
jgi:predicted  nucleic acid-binding Zn-ribbon protein